MSDTVFFRNRGDNGEVYLNRPNNASLTQTGRFCCEVPDATGNNQTLCVIIGRAFITAFGSSIAGESYALECSTGGTEATFHWLGSDVNDSSVSISSNLSSSQLLFQPLQQSHDGPYSCRATTDEDTLLSEPIEITVEAPTISAQILNRTRATVGDSYNLTCFVFGAGQIESSITYQWTKNNDHGDQIQIGSNSSTLSFTPLHLSDAANYSCIATVSSSYLTTNITTMASQSLRIQIPTPSSITLTSNITNFILITGSNVALSCVVMLNSAVLNSEIFLVTVDAQLSMDGNQLDLTGPIVTGTIFTYTALLKSFQESDFGSYTCTATIRPHTFVTYLTGVDVLSDSLSINAVIPPPVDARAIQSNSSSPVEVSWSPPSNFETFYITGYRIFYDDNNEASNNISVPEIITSIGIRMNRSYVNDSVFLRTEADQLHSELINVPVEAREQYPATDMEERSNIRFLVEIIGTSVGAATMCLTVIAMVTIIVLCWWIRRKKLSNRNSISISENAAYGDTCTVSAKPSGIKEDYENLRMILKSVDDHSISDDKEMAADIYETISPSYRQPGVKASEYA